MAMLCDAGRLSSCHLARMSNVVRGAVVACSFGLLLFGCRRGAASGDQDQASKAMRELVVSTATGVAPRATAHARVSSAVTYRKSALPLTDCSHGGEGTVYDVGPGKSHEDLSDVPFETLKPGDMVRIHHRPEPYRNVLLLSARGSAEHPIRLCGVRSDSGERPVLEAERATTASQAGMAARWNSLALILFNRHERGDYHRDYPAHWVVEGLRIQGAREGVPFTDVDGKQQTFEDGSSCISVIRGKHLTFRDNEITNCGFGLFAKSTDLEAERVEDILIEGNYIHGNNPDDLWSAHNVYTQALGIVVQFNRLVGSEKTNNFKDRSTGLVFRYNYVDRAGAHNLDLVEAEEYRETANQDPRYRQTYVYGNLIRQVFGAAVVQYGGDHYDPEYLPYFRKGDLYFFHNTVVMEDDWQPGSKKKAWSHAAFVVTTVEEKVHLLNNIFDYRGHANSFELMGMKEVHPFEQGGHFILGVNWLPPGWVRNARHQSEYFGSRLKLGADGLYGVLQGEENVIVEPLRPVDPRTWRPNPELQDRADPLPAYLVENNHEVTYQYDPTRGHPEAPLTQIVRRTTQGQAPALGALEERGEAQ